MNIEIKERIDKIQNNIVPEGYKKTKVGIIPEDWEVKKLEKVSKITMGQSPRSENYNNLNIGLPLIQGNADLKNGYTNPSLHTSEITKVCAPGDIIMSVRAPVGALAKSKHKACIGRGVCSIKNNEYLYYYLKENQVLLKRYAQGSTFEAINSGDIRNLDIKIPKEVIEQQKIADILSTWDKAIELKGKLIKEKEEQKKGLMQKLLTGEVRLPRFDGEWEEVKLGDVSETRSGGTPKSTIKEYYDGEIPWASISDITRSGKILESTEKNITEFGLENSAAKLYRKNTILYAMYASIGECSIAKKEVTSSQAILNIEVNKNIEIEYIYYYLCSLKDKIKLQGQQGTQSNLNAAMVRDIKLNLPPLKEQQAIAEILSIADKEIELLKELVKELKEQKKGLMQLLLAGIVRV